MAPARCCEPDDGFVMWLSGRRLRPSLGTVSTRTRLRLCRALVAAAVTVLVVGAPVPASAHGGLDQSSPRAGERLTRPPSSVKLLFSESVLSERTTVAVTGPGGRDVTAGPAAVTVTLVATPLEPLTKSGRYTVAYEVASDDGDVVSDSYTFTLDLAAADAAGPGSGDEQPVAVGAGAVAEEPTGVLWWVVVVAALLAAALGAVVTIAGRRQGARPEVPEPSR